MNAMPYPIPIIGSSRQEILLNAVAPGGAAEPLPARMFRLPNATSAASIPAETKLMVLAPKGKKAVLHRNKNYGPILSKSYVVGSRRARGGQETFIPAPTASFRPSPVSSTQRQKVKVFWFFSSEKNKSLLFLKKKKQKDFYVRRVIFSDTGFGRKVIANQHLEA